MRSTRTRCAWVAGTLAALALALAVPVIPQVRAGAPGASEAPGSPAPPQGALAVRVTSPQMNADVGEGADITLAAEPTGDGDAVTRVEFLDDDTQIGTVTRAPYQLPYHPPVPKPNFRFTARVTDGAGHSAVSAPVTCVATSKARRQYGPYDYEELGERDLVGQVRLWIPEGLPTVRGLLVVSNPAGCDTRDAYAEVWYEEFMHLHDFGFVGTQGFGSHVESVRVLQHALQQIARDSGHPELVNVPYATTGFSAGGGFASRLLVEVPDRTIASVPVGSRLNFTNVTPSAATLGTPACIISGETEQAASVVEPVLEAYRPEGALFGWMTVQGRGHERCGQDVLGMPLLDAAVRARYPADGDVTKGPIKLIDIDPSTGWIADNTTWKSGLTKICPAKEFQGDLGHSSWLQTEDLAFIYRAYATYDKPLAITSPGNCWPTTPSLDPGSDVPIVVDAGGFPNWQKLEFYDGATELGQITQGPTQFTATKLTPGYHVFSVLGTDAAGTVRTSDPALVVVRPLPAPG